MDTEMPDIATWSCPHCGEEIGCPNCRAMGPRKGKFMRRPMLGSGPRSDARGARGWKHGGHHGRRGCDANCERGMRGQHGRHGRQGRLVKRHSQMGMKGMQGKGLAAERMLRHAAALELNDAQIAKLEKLSTDAQKELIDLRADMQKQKLEMRQLMDDEDMTAIKRHLNTTAKLRVEMQEIKIGNWIESKKILSDDQKEKIKENFPGLARFLD
jgi:ribosomal protein L15